MRNRLNTRTATSLRPVKGEVLLEPVWPEDNVRGIYVPSAFKEDRPQEATVVALAVGADTDAKIGDRVITDRFAGKWVELGGSRYRLVEARALLAVVGSCDEDGEEVA